MISDSYETQIQQLFTNRGWTLSSAESCTGGAAAARLTALTGASAYYKGGVIAYSNELKAKALGVNPLLIKEKGAVSEEVVKQMVDGLLTLTDSDFAMAVTGVAGPTGGTASKPVGTVWLGVGRKGKKPLSWLINLNGKREEIILGGVNALLEGLLKYAQDEVQE